MTLTPDYAAALANNIYSVKNEATQKGFIFKYKKDMELGEASTNPKKSAGGKLVASIDRVATEFVYPYFTSGYQNRVSYRDLKNHMREVDPFSGDGLAVFEDHSTTEITHYLARINPGKDQAYTYWTGAVSNFDTGQRRAYLGEDVSESYRFDDQLYVRLLSQKREHWKKRIVLENVDGEIISEIDARDDFAELNAMNLYTSGVLSKKSESEITDLYDGRYLQVYSFDGKNAFILYGVKARNYDSFFSSQGYYLPTVMKVVLVNQDHPKGINIASIPIEKGTPVGASGVDNGVLIHAADMRDRKNVRHYYHQLSLISSYSSTTNTVTDVN